MLYSNSERSVQFLKQNDFLTYSWMFLRSNTLEQVEFKLEKIIDTATYRKMLEKAIIPTIYSRHKHLREHPHNDVRFSNR